MKNPRLAALSICLGAALWTSSVGAQTTPPAERPPAIDSNGTPLKPATSPVQRPIDDHGNPRKA